MANKGFFLLLVRLLKAGVGSLVNLKITVLLKGKCGFKISMAKSIELLVVTILTKFHNI